MDAIVDVTGLDTVLAGLAKLDDEMQGKTFKAATKAGAKIILAVAEADAPKRSGFMASHIKIRSTARPSKGIFRSSVGIDSKDYTGEAFYGSFVLWGHKAGSRKLGDNRKEVKGNNFLKRSAETAGENAANAMIAEIQAGIDKGTK